ncbi:hypothetical protein [Niastella populi]|uniref:Uncharacterized protein n=1 Tax=Niastella populi TaxID=550983 RepID=A0A1V9FHC9_9BACT|nr:hypothetical protein [Niastella populi]OQP57606.1 hypothetical protein A4R26_24085 [Niastella populi]
MNAVCERKVLDVELVKADPLDTIAGVFDSIDFDYFRANCNRWFHAVIINQSHVYDEEDRRTGLQTLFVDLELLLEAIYVIHINASGANVTRRPVKYDKVYLLTHEQADNPNDVLCSFFKKFSMPYIRQELKDWLQAGIDIDASDPVQLKAIKVLLTFNDLECLLEAAYQYCKYGISGIGKRAKNSLAML